MYIHRRNVKKINSCEKTYLLPVSQGMDLQPCFQSTPHGEVATDTQFTELQQEVPWYSIIMVNALTLNMHGKAYNIELDVEN